VIDLDDFDRDIGIHRERVQQFLPLMRVAPYLLQTDVGDLEPEQGWRDEIASAQPSRDAFRIRLVEQNRR